MQKNHADCAKEVTVLGPDPRYISVVLWITRAISAVFSLVIVSACATPVSRRGSEPALPDGIKIEAGAYAADWFTFNKEMKVRPPNDYVYYFKHCSLLDRRAYYWQSEFGCTPP